MLVITKNGRTHWLLKREEFIEATYESKSCFKKANEDNNQSQSEIVP